MEDNTERVIAAACEPSAWSTPWIFAAKYRTLSSVSTKPTNHPLISLPFLRIVPVLPYSVLPENSPTRSASFTA